MFEMSGGSDEKQRIGKSMLGRFFKDPAFAWLRRLVLFATGAVVFGISCGSFYRILGVAVGLVLMLSSALPSYWNGVTARLKSLFSG